MEEYVSHVQIDQDEPKLGLINFKKLLEELKYFENFTVSEPSEKYSVHIKYVLHTEKAQSMIESLEMLKNTDELIFWAVDDKTVVLGEVSS